MHSRRFVEISVKGKRVQVPAADVDGRNVIVTGRLVKIARIHHEDYTPGETSLSPQAVRQALREAGLRADIFTFCQRVGDEEPRYPYKHEWDNVAALDTTDYHKWWVSLSEATRRNVRLSSRRGVTVTEVPFDDDLVAAIKSIYDETPMRQGRPFWHYGKDLETVRRDNSSFLDKSFFLAAKFEGTTVGFLKAVCVDHVALVMQILATEAHRDKKTMNALIAKAVEVCHGRGLTRLVYCKYTYGNKGDDSVAEFKRRNGFGEVRIPQYFIPLTNWGTAALALGLQRPLIHVLPPPVLRLALRIRTELTRRRAVTSDKRDPSASPAGAEE